MPTRTPDPAAPYFLHARFGVNGDGFWEVAWRHRAADGTTRQVKRRLGPAWIVATGEGWARRPGRCRSTHLDERAAHVAAEAMVRVVDAELLADADEAHERRAAGATFREVAAGYMEWLEHIRGAKPSTLREHRTALVEPGTPHLRGDGKAAGRIMAALGDRPANDITTRDINALLTVIAKTGVAPRTVNRHRQLISAIYGYGCHEQTFGLPKNPATNSDRRREPQQDTLDYYSPEEVEALARGLAAGIHRDPARPAVNDDERFWRRYEDEQDADAVRVAAYTGLRRGELTALRWRDVYFPTRKIVVRQTVSADVVSASTKSGRSREVPMSDQTMAALDRLQSRGDFTSPSDFVLANRVGTRLDGSALRRRVDRARERTGLRPIRFHDLRHTFGSLLVANGVDLATVKAAMGHSRITTTERYLHARPAHEVADRFTQAFAPTSPDVPAVVSDRG